MQPLLAWLVSTTGRKLTTALQAKQDDPNERANAVDYLRLAVPLRATIALTCGGALVWLCVSPQFSPTVYWMIPILLWNTVQSTAAFVAARKALRRLEGGALTP